MDTPARNELSLESCKPLAPGSSQLAPEQVTGLLTLVPEWRLINDGSAITRTYSCSSYMNGVKWFALAAAIAEQEDHHPDALVTWCKVTLTLWTHTVSGLSRNDFIAAAKFDSAWDEFSTKA